MSCNHCNAKFNFFHKEMGCNNCGLSFCNKCLKQKCRVPNKGPNECTVCRTCYSKLMACGGSSSASQSTTIIPPDTFIKSRAFPSFFLIPELRRLENLENPAAPPITIYRQDPKIQALRSGLSAADQKIVDRLEKLKEDKGVPPSESELRRRLASLKGENEYVEGPSKAVYTVDTRSDLQKSDALLEQFINERDIELAHNPQEEIEARLATLRGRGVRPNEGAYVTNLHDSSSSEEEADKVTRKIMERVALDERSGVSNEDDESGKSTISDPEELPWCVLCNKDARYRCYDCGGDLYCSECNTEVHKNFGDEKHKRVPFKPK